MSREKPMRRAEDGRFEYLEPREVGKLLDVVRCKVGQCISCEAPVAHPIDLESLVDRYTRQNSTDGVRVPVKIRGVIMVEEEKLAIDLCRVCSDVHFDIACARLGIEPVTDVTKRLTVTRSTLEWAIKDRERQLVQVAAERGKSLRTMDLPRFLRNGSRRAVDFKRERNKISRARHRDGVDAKQASLAASRKALQALRERLTELERLQVDGIPDQNVVKICEGARNSIWEARYVQVTLLALRIMQEERGLKSDGRSKFGKYDAGIQ